MAFWIGAIVGFLGGALVGAIYAVVLITESKEEAMYLLGEEYKKPIEARKEKV